MDLTHFMERSVRESDRVLMVCTETYAQKARERQGGVGYEQMLVTGQMMRAVGTAKFIPIIRQRAHPYDLPGDFAGRSYIDLSGGPYQQDNFQNLLRELHDVGVSLPPLGPRPF